VTLTEKEESIQELTNVLLAGKPEEAKQSTYAALAKGSTNAEVLDALVEAASIVVDLQDVGQVDQARLAAVESSINTCLQVLEEWLVKSQGKFGVKVTVGPVGLRTGALTAVVISAAFRSVGFHSTSLPKTQTALDLLRNSEEMGANLVVPLFPSEGVEQHLRSFAEELEHGGFRTKFEVIPIAPGLPDKVDTTLLFARNSEEAISKATRWALGKQVSGRESN
jgi:methanogenic corrinoid protein MtbC1